MKVLAFVGVVVGRSLLTYKDETMRPGLVPSSECIYDKGREGTFLSNGAHVDSTQYLILNIGVLYVIVGCTEHFLCN